MSTELPDIGAILAPILERVAPQHRPLVLAQRELVSAARYRVWADAVADTARRRALLACAAREDEIARRIEGLYPAAAVIQQAFLARHPELANLTAPLYARHTLDQQFAMHARAERFGAATWRSFADNEQDPKARAVFLGCALLEEESAAFLESMAALRSNSLKLSGSS